MNLSLKDNLKRSFWALWILLMFFGFGLLLIVGNYEFSVLVNSWHNDSLDFLFQNLTYLGDGFFVFLIAFLFIFFKKISNTNFIFTINYHHNYPIFKTHNF